MFTRTFFIVVIGLLVISTAGLGYLYYDEQQDGLDIKIDKHGVTIDGK